MREKKIGVFGRLKNYFTEWLNSDAPENNEIIYVCVEERCSGDEYIDLPVPIRWLTKNGWSPGDSIQVRRTSEGITFKVAKQFNDVKELLNIQKVKSSSRPLAEEWSEFITVDVDEEDHR